jgi:hypothetical protein
MDRFWFIDVFAHGWFESPHGLQTNLSRLLPIVEAGTDDPDTPHDCTCLDDVGTAFRNDSVGWGGEIGPCSGGTRA